MLRLKFLREERNWNMKEAAEQLGIPYTTYISYEKGEREPNSEMLIKLSDFFNVSVDYLIGNSPDSPAFNLRPVPSSHRVPRLGRIACGDPIVADENIEDYDEVPAYVQCDFSLVCRGDSMINARIFDGDIVCIRADVEIRSGDIAAVLIDGDEATLKRVQIFEDHITLLPENPLYRPTTFWEEDMNRIRIIGKATHFISLVR